MDLHNIIYNRWSTPTIFTYIQQRDDFIIKLKHLYCNYILKWLVIRLVYIDDEVSFVLCIEAIWLPLQAGGICKMYQIYYYDAGTMDTFLVC